jgi:hypothetical protein
MLYISEVYNLLLDELRTDRRGNSVDQDTFNRLIRLISQEIYEQYVDRFEDGQESSDDLGFLKVHNYEIPLTAGVGTLPFGGSPYERLIGKPRILYTDGVTYKKVDLVTTYEQSCRDDDYLTQSTMEYPTCTIGGVEGDGNLKIRVYPTTATKVWIDYLKTLTVPFLDYYVNDTTYNVTYLAETGVAQNIPAGSTYRDGTIGGAAVNVLSQTKNLQWGEGDLAIILTKLVNRVAKQLPDELLLQTSNMEQAKSEE